jgi:TonB family protein
MLCYWQDWVVPLLGDFAHNVSPAKATVRPVAILLPDAEYPAALRGTGFAGTAGVEALVDYDGSVVAARVRQSSGAAAADSAACAAALGSSFSKAECYGAACRVWVTIPYTWEHVEKEDLKSSKPSQLYDESRDRY